MSSQQHIPNFAKIKIPNTSPASKFTQHKTSITSIKDEIKYLYILKKKATQQTTFKPTPNFS